jgi:hypothetical protein
MVFMDPYEAEALMRFNATVSLNGLSTKEDTIIETSTSLNFASIRIFLGLIVAIKIVSLLLS